MAEEQLTTEETEVEFEDDGFFEPTIEEAIWPPACTSSSSWTDPPARTGPVHRGQAGAPDPHPSSRTTCSAQHVPTARTEGHR